MDNSFSFDDIDSEGISDPNTFDVTKIVRKGAVFVIPIDTPVPSEMSNATIAVGSLYDRLSVIANKPDTVFAFCPLSGAELNHLDRAWRLLAGAHDIVALTDLPGGRYDILFTTALRSIGLKKLDWTTVSTELINQVVHTQRVRDSTPWKQNLDHQVEATQVAQKRKLPKTLGTQNNIDLSEPAPDED